MNKPAAIFFDIDGVVLDSLPPHLRICRDKAREFNLQIDIPSEAKFKDMIAAGVKISPMYFFFKAVGFPDNIAIDAVKDYEKEFMQKYQPKPFVGYLESFKSIWQCGWQIGIVTSNVRSNVMPAISAVSDLLNDKCIFTHDSVPLMSKASCLTEGARILKLDPTTCYYVGDLQTDAEAAREARFNFIGAAYGWGKVSKKLTSHIVYSLSEIPSVIGCKKGHSYERYPF